MLPGMGRLALSSLCLLVACGSDAGGPEAPDARADAADAAGAAGADLDMQAADFECVLRWDMVDNYRITNRLGHDAAAVARNPAGGEFPVGTIIQLVPTEAMVKRRAGFDATTRDWEFFLLGVSSTGTTVTRRGTTDVVNAFGGNCLDCHALATPQFDLVCGTTHGCDPLPLSRTQLLNIQNGDPRCP